MYSPSARGGDCRSRTRSKGASAGDEITWREDHRFGGHDNVIAVAIDKWSIVTMKNDRSREPPPHLSWNRHMHGEQRLSVRQGERARDMRWRLRSPGQSSSPCSTCDQYGRPYHTSKSTAWCPACSPAHGLACARKGGALARRRHHTYTSTAQRCT